MNQQLATSVSDNLKLSPNSLAIMQQVMAVPNQGFTKFLDQIQSTYYLFPNFQEGIDIRLYDGGYASNISIDKLGQITSIVIGGDNLREVYNRLLDGSRALNLDTYQLSELFATIDSDCKKFLSSNEVL